MDAIHSAKKNYIQAEGSEMRFIRMKKKSILERKITEVEKVLQQYQDKMASLQQLDKVEVTFELTQVTYLR